MCFCTDDRDEEACDLTRDEIDSDDAGQYLANRRRGPDAPDSAMTMLAFALVWTGFCIFALLVATLSWS
jgi:hypothetical protein